MRISDCSSDECSSDLDGELARPGQRYGESIHGVADEIEHHLLNLNLVDEDQIDDGIEGESHMNVMLAGPDERECARLLDELGQAFNGAFGLAARYEIAQAPNDIARAKRPGRRPTNRIGTRSGERRGGQERARKAGSRRT